MIPKVLHFCFGMSQDFGGKPWGLVHHACVLSAITRIQPTRAFLYYEFEPSGPWWRLTRELLTPVEVKAPRAIFGKPVSHPAHRADIVRLEKLLELGGIYLDVDVFVHRDFDDLLQNSVVLGREAALGHRRICNAVILAAPGAPFLQRWLAEYRSFRSEGYDDYWDEHSVRVPSRLAQDFPEEATVLLPDAFFPASWENKELLQIFSSTDPFVTDSTYATHLWETFAWNGFLRDLTPGRVRRVESNFHRWCRPYLRELPDDFGARALPERPSSCAIITTCKGRLAFLRRTLPLMVETGFPVTVVDFDCPDGTADFVTRNFPTVNVVSLKDKPIFNLSAARNAGAQNSESDIIAFIDSDVTLSEHFREFVNGAEFSPDEFFTRDLSDADLIGQCIVPRLRFEEVGGYDEAIVGWGHEDFDLYIRLERIGARRRILAPGIMSAITHEDDLRLKFTSRGETNKYVALWLNSVYSHIKLDIEGASRTLMLAERLELRQLVEQAIGRVQANSGPMTFSLSLRQLSMGPFTLDSSLDYTLSLAR